MRMVTGKRGRVAGKRLPMAPINELIQRNISQQTWVSVGLAAEPDSSTPHYSIEDGDVFMEIEVQPSQKELTCRLIAPAGLWRIPSVGEEVVVFVPEGDVQFVPLCMPQRNEAPDALNADDTVLFNERGKVVFASSGDFVAAPEGASLVRLGSAAASQSLVKGDLYRGAEDTLFSALSLGLAAFQTWFATWVTDVGTLLPVAPTVQPAAAALNTAVGAMITAIGAFQAAAASYLSTKTKTD